MVLTGDIFSAQEAERLGLVNKVVPPDELEAATMELAAKIAHKSPLAVQIGKTGIYGMSEIPYHQALNYMDELFASLCATKDALEGIDAFLEKRDPVWKLQ
jgi:enoyl-CoA hydratase/carnithine racemase